MIEVIFAAMLGCMLGIFAGLMPGVGIITVVSAVYLLLLSFDVTQLIMFYFCLVASSQYFGSVPAIFLGIAGEASSFPAVIEGHALMKKGKGLQAIFLTGIGSFVGGVVGILALTAVGWIGYSITFTTFQTMIMFLVIGALVCAMAKNVWYVSLLLFLIAIVLTHVGVSDNEFIPYFNFGISWLSSGVSYFPLAAAFISVKEIAFFKSENSNSSFYLQEKIITPLKDIAANGWCMIRGSLAGALGGLVPGVTTIASSHFAYTIEKYLQKKTYKQGNMPAIVSSESANNSGAITQLIPLLLLGVPITGSEAILYGILESKNWDFGALLPVQLFLEYWYVFIVVNFIGLVLSIKFAPHLIKLFPRDQKYLVSTIVLVLMLTTYYIGESTSASGVFDLMTFFVAVIILMIFPKVDYLPLIFWMVIGQLWIESFYRWLQIIGFQ